MLPRSHLKKAQGVSKTQPVSKEFNKVPKEA
jgi:hypothetical protein